MLHRHSPAARLPQSRPQPATRASFAFVAAAFADLVATAAPPSRAQRAVDAPSMQMPASTAASGAADESSAGADAASTRAYQEANRTMHQAMQIRYTGDADVDFVRGMIPHHQGAIEMARIVVQHGKDPTIRRMARSMIQAQQREIGDMQRWLARHGGDVSTHVPARR